jgi:hypothetical protein
MDNSRILQDNGAFEPPKPKDMRERQGETRVILEALRRVSKSQDWQTLKKILPNVQDIETRIAKEASQSKVNLPELYRLQGQLAGAKKHNLEKLAEQYSQQLEGIKKQL